MKIKPLNDWIVIKRSDAEDKSAGGIIIPEVAKEKPQIGIVEAVGPGVYKEGEGEEKEKKFVPTELKPGQKVLYDKYMGSDLEIGGKDITIIREEHILGVFEE